MDSERRPRRVIQLLAAAAAVLVGCAPGGATTSTTPLIVPTRPVVVPDSATFVRVHADSVRHPYTAADVQFMSGMIPHHSQAIAMARMTPTHGASPTIRRLADRIINAQLDEIVTMQQWLADRRQRVPEARPGPMKMVMNGLEHE